MKEGVLRNEIRLTPSLDLRYRGQSYTLNVPWQGDVDRAMGEFHRMHAERYGHSMSELPIELVNVRMQLQGPDTEMQLQAAPSTGRQQKQTKIRMAGLEQSVAVLQRDQLQSGEKVNGPALICETVSTSYISTGWQASVEPSGSLRLQRL